ncbi:MAG: 4-hydroxy-tetrahydrodipicolinate reductase [Nitrospirales bacterium]
MGSPVRVIVTGAAGQMGSRLVSLVKDSQNLELAGATEAKSHPSLGKDVGEVVGCGPLGILLSDDLGTLIQKGDVVVDFTTPSATLEHLRQALDQKRAMVIGTTGFSPDELSTLREQAQSIPCVVAPNMSAGINVLLQIIGKVAQALGNEYDLEVIEAHHHKKKDAPSGTALKLAETLAHARGWDLKETGVFARQGMIGERSSREIGIQTIRAGDIVGDHTIIFGGLGERVEITHRAHNRDPFARGALRAAEWVIHQPPGVYTMAQVLGL